jgi:hypothetical protein
MKYNIHQFQQNNKDIKQTDLIKHLNNQLCLVCLSQSDLIWKQHVKCWIKKDLIDKYTKPQFEEECIDWINLTEAKRVTHKKVTFALEIVWQSNEFSEDRLLLLFNIKGILNHI